MLQILYSELILRNLEKSMNSKQYDQIPLLLFWNIITLIISVLYSTSGFITPSSFSKAPFYLIVLEVWLDMFFFLSPHLTETMKFRKSFTS